MRTLNTLARGALALLATVAVALVGLFDTAREITRGVRSKIREAVGPTDVRAVVRLAFALTLLLATTLVVDHYLATWSVGGALMAVGPSTILLKGSPLRKEGLAGGAITPGHLIQGPNTALVVHAAAAGNARKAFAVEWVPDKEIDDAYAAGEQMMYVVGHRGDEIYALVAAGAAAIAIGDALESAGDGTLRKHTPPSDAAGTTIKLDAIVGYALEALDNSGGASAARLKVEVA